MNTPRAWLTSHRHDLLPNRSFYTYTWDGPADGLIEIDSEKLYHATGQDYCWNEFPQRLTCFPWPLRKVADHPHFCRDTALYARTDKGNRLNWLRHIVKYRSECVYTWLKYRLILTAHVWGLAHVPANAPISWSHLKKPRFKFVCLRSKI